ncbi:MinD/ParA family protein [Sporolituus thermophilus]|uniref:Flagellar biosynthesis protein FlhG n=1 Tax=Sporolituus thermophilus DSM 23256 TaxID=1123285 RepID=A0A1G7KQ99_9FIRM|nr:MinD/ParA family protein [Sporolituus thermophilus]SDF39365.1 flagellar biosynthesis protein FlhG [Sporolituus thermophilus DSM 23256]
MYDQAEKLRQMVQSAHSSTKRPILKQLDRPARVITVTSGKGGVGKTNFTVNLALAFASLGQKVVIIDADLGMANVDIVLGSSSPYNILHLLNEGLNIYDIVAEGPWGIKFLSGGSGIYQLANLSGDQLSRIVSQITLFDSWADLVLIDTGAGLSRNVLNFVMAADEVIIITTPEPTAITDAYAMIKAYASHQGTAPLKLVINRVANKEEGDMAINKLAKVTQRFLGISFTSLGLVYEDRNMINAVKLQKPLMLSYPDTISARCIEHIAQRLLCGENTPRPRGIKAFFSKFLEMMW